MQELASNPGLAGFYQEIRAFGEARAVLRQGEAYQQPRGEAGVCGRLIAGHGVHASNRWPGVARPPVYPEELALCLHTLLMLLC